MTNTDSSAPCIAQRPRLREQGQGSTARGGAVHHRRAARKRPGRRGRSSTKREAKMMRFGDLQDTRRRNNPPLDGVVLSSEVGRNKRRWTHPALRNTARNAQLMPGESGRLRARALSSAKIGPCVCNAAPSLRLRMFSPSAAHRRIGRAAANMLGLPNSDSFVCVAPARGDEWAGGFCCFVLYGHFNGSHHRHTPHESPGSPAEEIFAWLPVGAVMMMN